MTETWFLSESRKENCAKKNESSFFCWTNRRANSRNFEIRQISENICTTTVWNFFVRSENGLSSKVYHPMKLKKPIKIEEHTTQHPQHRKQKRRRGNIPRIFFTTPPCPTPYSQRNIVFLATCLTYRSARIYISSKRQSRNNNTVLWLHENKQTTTTKSDQIVTVQYKKAPISVHKNATYTKIILDNIQQSEKIIF